MNATLSTRLIVWVGVPAALLFAIVLWVSSLRSTRSVVAETESRARTTARFYAARLDGRLKEAAKIPAMHARALESGAFQTKEELETYSAESLPKARRFTGAALSSNHSGLIPRNTATAHISTTRPRDSSSSNSRPATTTISNGRGIAIHGMPARRSGRSRFSMKAAAMCS